MDAGGYIRPYDHEIAGLWRVCDLCWITLCLVASLAIHGIPLDQKYALLGVVAPLLFYFAAELLKLYRSWRSEPIRAEIAVVGWVWICVVVALFTLGYAFKVTQEYSRLGVGTWFVLVLVVLGLWRALVRSIVRGMRSKGRNSRKAVIVGTADVAMDVARSIRRAHWMGVRLVGFFDDRARGGDRIREGLPAPLLGTCADMLRALKAGEFDIVYVTLPVSDSDRIAGLLDALHDTTASVYVIPDMFLFSMFQGRWARVGDLPAVSIFETPFYGVAGTLKRIEDVILATGVLTVMALPMLAIAIGVKLTSRGPVLFHQRRYGLDGTEFRIRKFRTMTVCEDGDRVRQARPRDARVTRFGAFLRKTSLDELPQFLNVLQGTMSVVGPRPHATSHNEHYRKLIRGYMVRHKVRPGITGWAQVNGWRGETETVDKMAARVEHDLWYIRNWTLMLDLRIVTQTAKVFWQRERVY